MKEKGNLYTSMSSGFPFPNVSDKEPNMLFFKNKNLDIKEGMESYYNLYQNQRVDHIENILQNSNLAKNNSDYDQNKYFDPFDPKRKVTKNYIPNSSYSPQFDYNNLNLGPKEVSSMNENKDCYINNSFTVKSYHYKEIYNDYSKPKTLIKIIDCFNRSSKQAFFSIFEGIGNDFISQYLQNYFHEEFRSVLNLNKNVVTEKLIINMFKQIDMNFSEYGKVGSTACIAFIQNDTLFCFNLGDIRCLICSENNFELISKEDRVSEIMEKERVIKDGGFILNEKVGGELSVTRTFGNWEIKKYGISNVPHFFQTNLLKSYKFIILGTAEIFNILTNDDIFKLSKKYKNSKDLSDSIFSNILKINPKINASMIVIQIYN